MKRLENSAPKISSGGNVRQSPQTDSKRVLSFDCAGNQGNELARSLAELGYDTGEIAGSDRNTDSLPCANSKPDRQYVVTLERSHVSGCSEQQLAADAPEGMDAALDPIVVLHEALFSAGIDPASLSELDEANCSAA